jgi:hypothetical protein
VVWPNISQLLKRERSYRPSILFAADHRSPQTQWPIPTYFGAGGATVCHTDSYPAGTTYRLSTVGKTSAPQASGP